MMSAFYDLVLCFLGLVAAPWMVYQRWRYGKYRHFLRQRLKAAYPRVDKAGRKLVWIHAVSLGETRAVMPLAKRIKEEWGNPILVVSSVTETGHAEAMKIMAFADYHVFLPLDFHYNVSKVLEKLPPDVVLVTETDLWYQFLRTAKQQCGSHIAVVNAKISERSQRRLLRVPFFSKRLYGLVDEFCCQNELYRDRLLALGVSPDKLIVTGNIKFDTVFSEMSSGEMLAFRNKMGINARDKVVVIGSSHDPEEHELLSALRPLQQQMPNLKILLVPRHPERFGDVFALVKDLQFSVARLSVAMKGNEEVVLVDAMGVLRQCYQIADVSIVGGSFTDRIGGHNILEPAAYGVPVLFGPFMHAQPDLPALVLEAQAGIQIDVSGVADAVRMLLSDDVTRKRFGINGLRLYSSLQGSTARTFDALKTII